MRSWRTGWVFTSTSSRMSSPDDVGAGVVVVVARQEIDGQHRVGAEEIDRGRDKRVVHLVVFEKIAGDEEGVGLVLDGQFKRPTERLQSRLAQPAAGRTKLGETRAKLPVGRVE